MPLNSGKKISSVTSEIITHSPEDTIALGMEFASQLTTNSITGLFGNLGSGKTQFVKGVCEYFGVKENVNSPTFIIVNEYTGYDKSGNEIKINHFDLYRIRNPNEINEIGMESYVNQNSICLIEWAELADQYFKGRMKKIFFDFGDAESERRIRISL